VWGRRFAQEGLIREDYTLVDAVDKSDAITNVNATQQYLVVPLAYASPPAKRKLAAPTMGSSIHAPLRRRAHTLYPVI
jgi:hypothetical protein